MDLEKAYQLMVQLAEAQRVTKQEHKILETALLVLKEALGDKLVPKAE